MRCVSAPFDPMFAQTDSVVGSHCATFVTPVDYNRKIFCYASNMGNHSYIIIKHYNFHYLHCRKYRVNFLKLLYTVQNSLSCFCLLTSSFWLRWTSTANLQLMPKCSVDALRTCWLNFALTDRVLQLQKVHIWTEVWTPKCRFSRTAINKPLKLFLCTKTFCLEMYIRT